MKIIRTTAVVTTALTLTLGIFTFNPMVAEAEVPKITTTSPVVPMVETMESYFSKVVVTPQDEIAYITHQGSFNHFMDKVYTELPTSVTIEGITKERAEIWLHEYEEETLPSAQSNLHTLATYVLKTVNGKVVLKDQSHRTYSAKQIDMGVQAFARDFATTITHLSTNEKIQAIYNYIYSQYSYGASGYYEMKIGNAYNKRMACNGFSRMVYELALASGVPVKMIEAEDHFYNHVQVANGTWIILDVTTDIVLNQKYGSLGLSKTDYLAYVSQVGFYWATPVAREKAIASTWTKEDKTLFLSSPSPSLIYHQETKGLSISGFLSKGQ